MYTEWPEKTEIERLSGCRNVRWEDIGNETVAVKNFESRSLNATPVPVVNEKYFAIALDGSPV